MAKAVSGNVVKGRAVVMSSTYDLRKVDASEGIEVTLYSGADLDEAVANAIYLRSRHNSDDLYVAYIDHRTVSPKLSFELVEIPEDSIQKPLDADDVEG